MKEFLRKNFAIILAFILPVLLIVIVVLSTYLPSRWVATDYDFIYTTCVSNGKYYYSYNCNNFLNRYYSIINNRLAIAPEGNTIDLNGDGKIDTDESFDPRIFLHDTEKNESREITLAEAQRLTLSPLLTSPDGVTVSHNYNRGGDYFFPFGGSSSTYGYYLTKGRGHQKINLINNSEDYYYDNNFKFIGWLLPVMY